MQNGKINDIEENKQNVITTDQFQRKKFISLKPLSRSAVNFISVNNSISCIFVMMRLKTWAYFPLSTKTVIMTVRAYVSLFLESRSGEDF